jgi:hypothetical protein
MNELHKQKTTKEFGKKKNRSFLQLHWNFQMFGGPILSLIPKDV